MTAYAIQYRDGAWQLDPKNWHPDFVVHRVLAVYRSHPREHVETVRETLVWADDTEVVEWHRADDAGVRAFSERAR